MTQSLARAVDGLYAAFAAYPFNPKMERCDHCIDDEEFARLGGPLRDLSPDDASMLILNTSTCGGVDDFRHFLPRLLETVEEQWTDIEWLAVALGDSGWTSWPDAERKAVLGWLEAFWDACLAEFPGRQDARSFACALGMSGADPAPFLERWGALDTEAANRHRAAFVRDELGGPSNPWWKPPQRARFLGLFQGLLPRRKDVDGPLGRFDAP